MIREMIENGEIENVERVLRERAFEQNELYCGLMASIRKGDDKLVGLLLEKGVNPNQIFPEEWCPLHCAVEHRQIAIIKQLYEYGADINFLDESGSSPLHVAVDLESDSAWQAGTEPITIVTSALLALGADPHLKNRDGKDAIDIAKEYDNRNAIDVLRNYGNRR